MAVKFLSKAKVFHKRLLPKVNQFCYDVFYICFDIAKIDELKSHFLSVNSFNLFSFYNKDHGARDGENLQNWLQKILAEKNLSKEVVQVFLLTHPRILGYVFNPVSFWFCLDKNQNLIAILAEVNNTFGENHNYLICNSDRAPISLTQEFTAEKDFHVSPFLQREGKYKFRFSFNEKNIFVAIDYFNEKSEKMLLTSIACKNEKLTDFSLIKAFIQIPLLTLKVIFLIHFQAVKLLLKKIKYIPKPQQKLHKFTKND